MTLATLQGRLQSKAASYILAFALAAAFAVLTGNSAFFSLFAVMALVGLVLETIWGLVIVHQPGYLAFVFAGIEFVCVVVAANALKIPMSLPAGAAYYIITWIVTQFVFIYLLPVWHTRWLDNGREIW